MAEQPPVVVVMEACDSAHYWAREIVRLGHEVKLIAAQYVKPFVKRQKNDAADAHPNIPWQSMNFHEQTVYQRPKICRSRLIKQIFEKHLPEISSRWADSTLLRPRVAHPMS